MDLNKAMQEIADLNEKGGKGTTKVQGGKTYTNVSARVEVFRKHLGLEYGIETAPLFPAAGGLLMQAWVKDKDGFIVGTGHAYAQDVSKEKGIEKLESTAIGRAMASIGLSGGEYASENEMESWQERYETSPVKPDPSEATAQDIGKTPREWLDERLINLETFANTCAVQFKARCEKIGNDSIYSELTQDDIDHAERVLTKLEQQLTKKLKG